MRYSSKRSTIQQVTLLTWLWGPTWRAIEHGLELLKKGLIWQVGSSSKIQIWRDRWIPHPPSLIVSLRKGRSQNRWASQLMKDGHQESDINRLKACTFRHDTEEVLKIRLSDRIEEDFLAWHHEKSGIFSVRSAYRLALQQDQPTIWKKGSRGHPHGERPLW